MESAGLAGLGSLPGPGSQRLKNSIAFLIHAVETELKFHLELVSNASDSAGH